MVVRLGQKAPRFSLPDSDGNMRTLDEFVAMGRVLLVFFAFAFSGASDKDLCYVRDNLDSLNAVGLQPVGIGVDSVFTLKVFKHTYDFQFPLLSDYNKKVSREYGLLQDSGPFGYRGVVRRSIFVVDKRGLLRYRWMGNHSSEPRFDEVIVAVREAPW
jgi:peroxiredoxin